MNLRRQVKRFVKENNKIMHALEWLAHGDREPLRPVYVVAGNDLYLVRESMDAIARAVFPGQDGEASLTRFSGSQASLADVLDEVTTLPFLSRRRLVIVEEADGFVSKYRSELEAYVQSPCKSGILLLQVKTWVATARLTKLVDELGLAVHCTGASAAELVPWLVEFAQKRHDVRLDTAAARLLVDLLGPEAGILASEVRKLAVYAGDARHIESADVPKLVGAGRVETIWKTIDAATTGHARAALEHLDSLLGAGEEPVSLLAATAVSLLKIHHAGRLRTARIDLDEACRLAGIPGFAVEKTRKQHAHLGPARVDQLPSLLLRADLDLKGGSSLAAGLVLEMLMVHLSSPRAD
jgi:DNA polymerase III subunit delta